MKIAEYENGVIQRVWHSRELAERCKVQDIRELPDDHPDVLELREKQRAEMLPKETLESRIEKLEKKIDKLLEKGE